MDTPTGMNRTLSLYICAATLVAAFLLACAGAQADEGGALTLAGGRVYPSDARMVTAALDTTHDEKLKTEFVWTGPDGVVFAKRVKLGFPAAGAVRITDSIDPKSLEGWWTVKAVTDGGTYEKKFLVTTDNVILEFISSGKAGKLAILGGAGTGRDLLMVAMSVRDDEVRAAAVGASAGQGREVSDEIINLALKDGSWEVRREAVESFIRAGGDYSGHMDALLNDPVEYVREAYAQYLASAWPPESEDALGVLITDPSESVRRRVVEALRQTKAPGAITVLSKGFEVDDKFFRRVALDSLIERGGPDVAGVIADGLSDSDLNIRRAALEWLAEMDEPWPLDKAVPLVDDPDKGLAMVATGLLAEKGHAGWIDAALRSRHAGVVYAALDSLERTSGKAYINALIQTLSHPVVSVRSTAVARLSEMGRDGMAGLVKALGDTDDKVRVVASGAIELSGGPAEHDAMFAALADANPRVRFHAVRYFDRVAPADLPDILYGLADDTDSGVAGAAVESAASHEGKAFSRVLSAFYEGGDSRRRNLIVGYLSDRDDEYAVEGMRKALRDKDAGIRFEAVRYLHNAGELSGIHELALDSDRAVQREALEGMRDAPDKTMLDVLAETMKSEFDDVRSISLEILGGIEGDKSSLIISDAVYDSSEGIRDVARKMVLTRKDAGVVPGLVALAGDRESDIRSKALRALSNVQGGPPEDAMAELAGSKYGDVRAAAVRLLPGRDQALLLDTALQLLDDPEPPVRMAALDASGRLDTRGLETVIDKAMKSGDPEVRLEAIKLAGPMAGPEAEKGLEKALSDRDERIRYEALKTLLSRGSRVHRPYLSRLVVDESLNVASLALEAAMLIDNADLKVETLVSCATGPHRELARRAVDALLPLCDARALDIYVRYFLEGYRRADIARAMAAVEGNEPAGPLSTVYRYSSRDDGLRLFAVRSLAGRGAAGLAALIEALEDPSLDIRLQAVDSIATIEDPDVRGEALSHALADPNPAVYRAAFNALTKGVYSGSAQYVIGALDNEELRTRALGYISKNMDGYTAGLLSEKAAGIREEGFRARVVQALAEGGADANVLSGFATDPSDTVRVEAVKGLSHKDGPGAALGLMKAGGLGGEARGIAAKSLSGRDSGELDGALDMLFSGGPPDPQILTFVSGSVQSAPVLEGLVGRIPEGDEPRLRAVLWPLMSRSGIYDGQAMLDGLGRGDRGLDIDIIEALSRVEGDSEGALLVEAYRKAPGLRSEIINMAVKAGRGAAVVKEALDGTDVTLRRQAAVAAGSLETAHAHSLLMVAMKDGDAGVRADAALSASRYGNIDALIEASSDERAEVRVSALKGLSNNGGQEALGRMAELVFDGDRDVSAAAVEALSAAGDAVSRKTWLDIVTDPRSSLAARLSALKALKEGALPEEAGVYAGLLSGDDGKVSEAAAGILESIGRPSLRFVHPLLTDPVAGDRALEVVSGIRDASSEPALLALFEGSDDARKRGVLEALGTGIGGKDALVVLSDEHRSGGADMKVAVLKAVAGMRLEGDEPALVELLGETLDDPDEAVRFYAAHAAGSKKVTALKPALEKKASEEENALVRKKINDVLRLLAGDG